MRVMMGLGQLIKTFTFIKLELCLGHLQAADAVGHYPFCSLQEFLRRRFAAALLPRLFGNNIHDSRSHHKGATGRVRTGDQRYPVLCHCKLGQDIPLHICRRRWSLPSLLNTQVPITISQSLHILPASLQGCTRGL